MDTGTDVLLCSTSLWTGKDNCYEIKTLDVSPLGIGIFEKVTFSEFIFSLKQEYMVPLEKEELFYSAYFGKNSERSLHLFSESFPCEEGLSVVGLMFGFDDRNRPKTSTLEHQIKFNQFIEPDSLWRVKVDKKFFLKKEEEKKVEISAA